MVTGLILVALLCWGGTVCYDWQMQRTNDKITHVIQVESVKLQEQNMTVNNLAGSLDDSDHNEKVAFAIGVTGNIGKMSLWFDENEQALNKQIELQNANAKKRKATDTVIKVDKEFIKQRNITYEQGIIKTVRDFQKLFKKQIDSSNISLDYKIIELTPATRTLQTKYTYASQGFILNYYDPKIYRVYYTVNAVTAWLNMLPYGMISLLLLTMFILSYIFLEYSYKHQLQTSRFREALFSNITHELKTPLSSIQLILGLESKTTSHIDAAKKELARMQLLVDKIISFGRMSQEDFELNKIIVDLNEVIAEAIEASSAMIDRSNAFVKYIKSENKINIAADKLLLVNAIITIVENAIKYSPHNPQVTIDVEATPEHAAITISDNGIGIDRAYDQKIFEPFFRIPTGNIHNIKGDGLGLSYAMQVLKLHKGNIHVVSTPGNGSHFTLIIPR